MKKIIAIIAIFTMIVMVSGCQRANEGNQQPQGEENPTNISNEESETYTIEDYFPYRPDTEYVYEGEGNEYASFRVYTDYYDEENQVFQTRTNNGGTELAKVIRISEGKLAVVYVREEFYHRDNLMDKAELNEELEILLMEPLVKGTEWTLPDGRRRHISNMEAEIETPKGSYKAMEVTTEGTHSVVIQYYALEVGLVQVVFQSGDMVITSSLSDIRLEVPFSREVTFYYANTDEQIYRLIKPLNFYTNDISRVVMQNAMKEDGPDNTFLPLISENTAINTMYLGEDNIVYVDLSEEFIMEMNAGAGYESLILQSITNTLGNYYGVEEIYITIDQKQYSSGHIQLREGETLKVNMN